MYKPKKNFSKEKILNPKNSRDMELLSLLHKKIIKAKTYPQQHLTAYFGLINDPNGLGKIDEKFHIFYQWTPFSTQHEKKHWGHFSTKDFVNFQHHKTFLKPEIHEEKDGCYSGSMVFEKGVALLFYTGNHKSSNKKNGKTSFTIKTKVKNLSEKEVLFEVDKSKYTENFRDPYPMCKNNDLFLLHGAQKINKTGTISVYKKVKEKFKLIGDLNLALEDNGYMLECPNYFYFKNSNFSFFAVSIEGTRFFEEFDKKCVFVWGKLNLDQLKLKKVREQVIDYGRDFYAPQIFKDKSRNILIAWFGMSEFDDLISSKEGFANALTLPREITYKNGFIYQKPLKELDKLIGSKIQKPSNHFLLRSKIKEKKWDLQFKGSKGFFKISYENKHFKIDWSKSKNKNLKSTTNKRINPYREIKIEKVENLEMWIDKTFFEIFINHGQYVCTQRVNIGNIQKISGNLQKEMFQLKPIVIKGWW